MELDIVLQDRRRRPPLVLTIMSESCRPDSEDKRNGCHPATRQPKNSSPGSALVSLTGEPPDSEEIHSRVTCLSSVLVIDKSLAIRGKTRVSEGRGTTAGNPRR